MELRRRRGAKGTAALALADFRVDPSLGEELRGDLAKCWSERLKSAEYNLPRLVERKGSDFFADRRVLIVQSESGKLEQLGFESEIVMRESIIRFGYVHHLADSHPINLVDKMALNHWVRIMAQTIDRQVILNESVVNKGESVAMLGQASIESLKRALPQGALGLMKEIEFGSSSVPASHRLRFQRKSQS